MNALYVKQLCALSAQAQAHKIARLVSQTQLCRLTTLVSVMMDTLNELEAVWNVISRVLFVQRVKDGIVRSALMDISYNLILLMCVFQYAR
jgi:hypothetical protein